MSLVVDHVTKEFRIRKGMRSSLLTAVDDVSFTLEPGKTIALVGESGSGKSTIAKMIMRLEPPTKGRITVDGLPSTVRGRKAQEYLHLVQMVYQDPFASLNPFHTIKHHVERPLKIHKKRLTQQEYDEQIVNLFQRVNLEPPEDYMDRSPHELSGGQRQRVAIARALAPGAKYLVADEPVSMLDVSIRLGVLNLLARLQREENLGVLYITHDLATARHFSDEIMVLYKGQVVERGPSDEVILNPQHKYTKLLLSAAPVPSNHGQLRASVREDLKKGTYSKEDQFGTKNVLSESK